MGFNDRAIARSNQFRIVDNIFCHFEHYDLFFLQFQKKSPAASGAEAATEDNSTTPLPIAGAYDEAAAGEAYEHKSASEDAAAAAKAASKAEGVAAKKRRLDEAGTILKPSSPFLTSSTGAAVPGMSLDDKPAAATTAAAGPVVKKPRQD